MIITIEEDETKLVLSDEELDNQNYVEIRLRLGDDCLVGIFAINDLMPALIAFDAKRSRYLEENKDASQSLL